MLKRELRTSSNPATNLPSGRVYLAPRGVSRTRADLAADLVTPTYMAQPRPCGSGAAYGDCWPLPTGAPADGRSTHALPIQCLRGGQTPTTC